MKSVANHTQGPRRSTGPAAALLALLALLALAALALASCGNLFDRLATERSASGRGTAADPYRIYTAEDLDAMRADLAAHYRLMADIDLSDYAAGEGWIPIGNSGSPFTGSLDGNGRTIRHLRIDRDADLQGLFGYLSSGSVSNLKLAGVSISSSGLYIGALAGGSLGSCSITACSASGEVSGVDVTGGLIGLASADIADSSFVGTVSGTHEVGGLVGRNEGAILRCFSFKKVTGSGAVGGLVGSNMGDIEDSYSQAAVVSNSNGGGFVGFSQFQISHCYSTGSVSGQSGGQGFCGFSDISYTTPLNYFDYESAGVDQSSTPDVATGKTTQEMMRRSTYVDWDFDKVWAIDEGSGYPYLRWERD